MKKIARTLLALITFGFLSPVLALQGESIVFNPATGNYLITHYSDFDRAFEQLTFIPATKINSTLKSKLKLEQEAIVHYGYSLISGRDSQQDIVLLILDPVSSVTTGMPDISLNAPPGRIMDDMMNAASYFDTPVPWSASMAYSNGQMSFRIGWSTKVANGFHPGKKAVFGFKSRDLPGIIKAEVYGFAPDSQKIGGEELPDAEDGGFGQQYFALLLNDFVRHTAAVPSIPVPTPFNAAVLIERIQTQAHTWIGMQLLDAFFSSRLDRYFAAAASAYSHNLPKAGKEHIETLRKMLKNEHDDMDKDEKEDGKPEGKDDKTKRSQIDPVAARVLDFNLKYVLKRIDKD